MYTVPPDSPAAVAEVRRPGQRVPPGKSSCAVMFAPEVMKAAWRRTAGRGLSAVLIVQCMQCSAVPAVVCSQCSAMQCNAVQAVRRRAWGGHGTG